MIQLDMLLFERRHYHSASQGSPLCSDSGAQLSPPVDIFAAAAFAGCNASVAAADCRRLLRPGARMALWQKLFRGRARGLSAWFLEPADALRFGLLAADSVGNAGDNFGAGVGSGGTDGGLFAFSGDGAATGAALIGHANFHPVTGAVQSGVGDEREEGEDKDGYDQPDFTQSGASLKKLPIWRNLS